MKNECRIVLLEYIYQRMQREIDDWRQFLIDTFKAANREFTYKGGRFTGVVHRIIARPPRPELWVQIDDEIGMVRLCFPFSQYGLTI